MKHSIEVIWNNEKVPPTLYKNFDLHSFDSNNALMFLFEMEDGDKVVISKLLKGIINLKEVRYIKFIDNEGKKENK